ncbi:hypothetical protein [Micromonospora echinaurantiaca]|uniref:hypothetical protein n=1 Tax=Micromonospora echinaurantiaca TaxID=47857 RepID=UPI00378C5339
MELRMTLPEPAYLLKIGIFSYAVSSLEWTALGDLSRLASVLPKTLTVDRLSARTTGQIANELADATPKINDVAVRAYVEALATALTVVAKRRNDLLHARPATVDGEQRLYRWYRNPKTGEVTSFAITDSWLDEQLSLIDRHSNLVSALRPPFDDA